MLLYWNGSGGEAQWFNPISLSVTSGVRIHRPVIFQVPHIWLAIICPLV
jgi:hypothetical protein